LEEGTDHMDFAEVNHAQRSICVSILAYLL
jgi:hypothetical protein